jgi:methylmalonyl-CoA mutase
MLRQEKRMPPSSIDLRSYFPEQPPEAWEEAANKVLKGKPLSRLQQTLWDGLTVPPVFPPGSIPDYLSQPPGIAPFSRGNASTEKATNTWEIRQTYQGNNPSQIKAEIKVAVTNGADSHWLTPSWTTRSRHAVKLANSRDMEDFLSEIPLDSAPCFIDTGAHASKMLSLWQTAIDNQGCSPVEAMGGLLTDPIGQFASTGTLHAPFANVWEQTAQAASWMHEHAPHMQSLCFSSLPAHDAGAHAVQEITYLLGQLVETLRGLETAGLSIEDAVKHASIRIGVGRHMFVEIAKIRALRVVVSKVLAACGLPEASQTLPLHACASRVTGSQRDRWVNLLRATSECFSAAIGGADAITLLPFDAQLDQTTQVAHRQTVTTQLVLAKESFLQQVIDPAGGSWYIEHLTDQMARQSWAAFQALEAQGGLIAQLQNGSFQQAIKATVAQHEQATAKRKVALLGVSEYPNPDDPIAQPSTDEQSFPLEDTGSATSGPTCEAFETFRLAKGWEELRSLTEQRAAERDKPFTLFLANIGPIPSHKARAAFSQRLMEAAGFSIVSNDGFPSVEEALAGYAASLADGVVICGSNEDYETWVKPLAEGLQPLEPSCVVLAGKMGEHTESWTAAGVTHSIYMGCDALATLRSLLEDMGGQA